MASIQKQMNRNQKISVGEDVNPCAALMEIQNGTATVENGIKGPHKVENKIIT